MESVDVEELCVRVRVDLHTELIFNKGLIQVIKNGKKLWQGDPKDFSNELWRVRS